MSRTRLSTPRTTTTTSSCLALTFLAQSLTGHGENIPTDFPPSDHTHEYVEVNNGAGKTLDVEISDILDAIASMQSEIGALQGNLTFGGTVDMSTDQIVSVTDAATDAGFSLGAIPTPPPNGSLNIYFIAIKAGDFGGDTYNSGDWLVSQDQAGGYSGVHFDATVSVDWSEIGNKPTDYPPSDHTHDIADVNGLQDALDDKTASGHTHEIADIDGLEAEAGWQGVYRANQRRHLLRIARD